MPTCKETAADPGGEVFTCERQAGHDDVPFDERPEGADGTPEDKAALKAHLKALHRSGLRAWGGIPGF